MKPFFPHHSATPQGGFAKSRRSLPKASVISNLSRHGLPSPTFFRGFTLTIAIPRTAPCPNGSYHLSGRLGDELLQVSFLTSSSIHQIPSGLASATAWKHQLPKSQAVVGRSTGDISKSLPWIAQSDRIRKRHDFQQPRRDYETPKWQSHRPV
jgi:hypothetical protein